MKKYFKVTRKNKKIILGVCVGTAVALAVGLGVYIYTADHNTLGRKISIYGMDVSKLTVEEAEQKILNGFQEQKVDFEEDGAEVYEVTLGDLGYSLDADDLKTQLQDLQKKREETRRLLASQEDYRIAYQVNKDADQEKSALVSENFGDKERTASVDASVQYDGQQKKFVMVNETQGNMIDEERLLNYVDATLDSDFQTGLLNGSFTITMGTEVYQQPVSATSKKMTKKLKKLNKKLDAYRSATVTYTLGSETQVLDNSTTEGWIKVEGENISIDQDQATAYVQQLATDYNTIYVPRTFHTTSGSDVTVSDNEYGFQIDQEGELSQLLSDLEGGKPVTRDPVYSISGMQRSGRDDLAGSYIEVSLDAQHLWLYKDGTLVTETDIVSGAPTPQRETMRGAWPIAYKASPYTLTSDQYGYNTKVTYWMPFVYGQGLHDATWQSSFGGNRYKSGAGSHGCINLPKDQAALIYNTIDGGYPIIIY